MPFFLSFFSSYKGNLLTENRNLRSPVHRRQPRRPLFLRVLSEGMGVTSSIRPIFITEWARALSADWAPGPGVLVLFPPVARSLMWRTVMPSSLHSGLHPGQPTWQHMEKTHLGQPLPSYHQLHGRWFPCQKDR